MLLEERLYQLSNDADKENMYSQWKIIKNKTESKLKTVCNYFPHFSKHDGSHSQAIATYISNLLGEERINKLSYSDILMMLLSFYKHDVGMALQYEEIYDRFDSSDFKETLDKYANDKTSDLYDTARRLQRFGGVIGAKDYEKSIDVYNDVILLIEDMYRSEHAKRSSDAIMKDSFLESTLHNRCQRILAEICEVHQKPITDIAKLQWKENGLFGDYFHPRFIGAMLCLGDLLDLDTDRFDEIMMKASTPFPQLSKLHLEKHKSICHFLVDKNAIEVITNTDDIEVYRVMRKWMDWMQEACDYIALHWSEIAPDDFGNAPRISKCELLLHGDTKWIPFANTKYEVSNKKMFELLQGSNIYNNKFVCIREIIQNAVDATLLRFFSEGILSGDDKSILQQLKELPWDDFEIKGEIKILDNTHVSVMIRDRGIGVSTDDIKKIANVSNVASAKRKELISKMPMWLRPSGAFGMGLQSIFLLADQFEMITKTSDESAKKIIFQSAENSDGYITVEDYDENFTQGTEIHFNIDGEKLSAAELNCSNYHYKRKELSNSVIDKIYGEYENQSEGLIPEIPWKKKLTEYVPVVIKCGPKKCTMLKYKPLFSADEIKDGVKVKEDGRIEVKKFIPYLNCHISSCIYLYTDKKVHRYGQLINIDKFYYLEELFYRNTFVKDHALSTFSANKEPIMSYMDWRINLLDAKSDEVLKISRNSIHENYISTFYKILSKALELAAEDVIDYLIDDYDEENKNLDDTILLVYQLAVHINYRANKLFEKYRNILSMIKINMYYLWGENQKKEEELTFDELRDGEVYFIIDEIECDDDTEFIDLEDKKCFKLDSEESNSILPRKHILNHRIENIFLGRKGNRYVKALKAIPFKSNSPDLLYELDDIFMLENIIRMIELNWRVIPAMRGYEILVTPINSCNELAKFGVQNEQYYIEMPFKDLISEMSKNLHSESYIPNAVDRYYEQIIQSKRFTSNIDYIKEIKNEKKKSIQDEYQKLVKKCLELLENQRYKTFNISLLEKIKKEKESNKQEKNPIDNNPYIVYKSIFLE